MTVGLHNNFVDSPQQEQKLLNNDIIDWTLVSMSHEVRFINSLGVIFLYI